MTTELKVTEELFQQALKAYGSFEIARSNAERVSMRQGFELGMQYARHHQADDATLERVTLAIAHEVYGPKFDPFLHPESYEWYRHIATAAIAAMREDAPPEIDRMIHKSMSKDFDRRETPAGYETEER